MSSQPTLRVESVPDLLVSRKGLLEPRESTGISKKTPTLRSRPSPPAGMVPQLGVDALVGGGGDPGPYCIGFTGQSTSLVGAVLPGPYVQASGAPHVDVEHVEDVDVDVVEVPRLLATRFSLLWDESKSLSTLNPQLSLHQEAQPQLPPPTYQ